MELSKTYLCYILVTLFSSFSLQAQWSFDSLQNNPVDTTTGRINGRPDIAGDQNNGYYIVWEKSNPPVYGTEIYAQHITANGTKLWPDTGVLICNARYNQFLPKVIPDGTGGAIITWQDERANFGDNDIYAQRVNSSGAILWATNGVPVISHFNNDDLSPKILSDGHGGAIITSWRVISSGVNSDIYCQRINENGIKLWGANGLIVCNATNRQLAPQIISDGNNGAIICWEDFRNSALGNTNDIYAQRIDGNGNILWAANGVPVCVTLYDNGYINMASDNNNGAYIVWTDLRNNLNPLANDIYAQRIAPDGTALWTLNGVPVCSLNQNQISPDLLTDTNGDVIIVWNDYRGQSSLYAQRLSPAGLALWSTNGIPVCTLYNNYITHPFLATDNNNGAFIVWENKSSGSGTDRNLYAQRINQAGNTIWPGNGVAICTAPNDQILHNSDGQLTNGRVIKDGHGGAIITWQDSRYDAVPSNRVGIFVSRLTNIPTQIPVVINVNNKCQLAATAKGKLLNPPVMDAGVYIKEDGIPLTYDPLDSSFIYFTSGSTVPGNHTINIKYLSFPGYTQKDTAFIVIATPQPAISISGITTLNPGESTTISSTINDGGPGPIYQWQDSTAVHTWANIAGATASSIIYSPAATGDKLRCLFTSNAECFSPAVVNSNSLVFTVNLVTALPFQPGNSYGIRHYPNPATETLIIDSLKLSDNWQTADIYSIDGKKKRIPVSLSGRKDVMVDISSFSPGTYIIVLSGKKRKSLFLKFIKL